VTINECKSLIRSAGRRRRADLLVVGALSGEKKFSPNS